MNIITNDKIFYTKLPFDSVIYNNTESFNPCNFWSALSVYMVLISFGSHCNIVLSLIFTFMFSLH